MNTTASHCGSYVASLGNNKVRVCAVRAPRSVTETTIRIATKDATAMRWSVDNNLLAIVSARLIEIIDLKDRDFRVRLDNGSGGLGRFLSADFVGLDQLLVVWEFGKAKLWTLSTGKGVDLSDIKIISSGDRWQSRPHSGDEQKRTLAALSKAGADDTLNLYLPSAHRQLSCTRLPTVDAQSLSWSPDGRWLAVLDTPLASSSVHIFTPGGQHFRSYPLASESAGLGVKAVVWSRDSQVLALTQHDGKLVLLNTRTFAPLAVIEHTTTIDQRHLSTDAQAPLWQEAVSASGERSYATLSQPFSPPLTRSKSGTEPNELGIAEARFSCDSKYLATRDERMLSTIWLWNMSTLAAHTVLIQHSNVRKLQWHQSRPEILLIDCGDGIAHVFDASSPEPPATFRTEISGAPNLSWICPTGSNHATLLATTKTSHCIVYLDGRFEAEDNMLGATLRSPTTEQPFDEGASEDSLFDILSGRKPMARSRGESYTRQVDLEVETEEEDSTTRMDDTFRGRRP